MGQQNPDNVQQTNSNGNPTPDNGQPDTQIDNVELAVQLEKVNSKNRELLGEVRGLKDERNQLSSQIGSLFEHLGVDPAAGDPVAQLSAKNDSKEQERIAAMSENEQLAHKVESLSKDLAELLNSNKAEREKRVQLELDKTVNEALTEAGINAKGRKVLSSLVHGAVKSDDSGFFTLQDGQRAPVGDYAKTLANEYPEFVEQRTVNGGGGFVPSRQTPSANVSEMLKNGDTRGALRHLVSQELNR